VLADHSVVSAEANGILRRERWAERMSIPAGIGSQLLSGEDAAPGGRGFGDAVTDHRSSWVRTAHWLGSDCYFKTYDYPTRRDRWRGLARTTVPNRSRARREWAALHWLGAHGFAVAPPIALAEARIGPFLRRSVLVTGSYGGPDLRWWLGPESMTEPAEVLHALADLVAALHRQGFHDRNLDPRNVLARRDAAGRLRLTKIDSPRFVLARPGSRHARRLVSADLARLDLGLRELGFTLPGSPGIRS
jgi:hypothetical protein